MLISFLDHCVVVTGSQGSSFSVKTLQQNEKIRSDSAFDKGTAIQISAMCKMLVIPSVSFKVNKRFHHLSGVTFDRNLFTCAYNS